MRFPCGPQLEKEAEKSTAEFKIRPSMKGCDCSFSGIENKVKNMISSGEKACDIAKFAISSVCASLEGMAHAVRKEYGELPILFAGGVSGNRMINNRLSAEFSAIFASPEFSSDNAAGTAVFAGLKAL